MRKVSLFQGTQFPGATEVVIECSDMEALSLLFVNLATAGITYSIRYYIGDSSFLAANAVPLAAGAFICWHLSRFCCGNGTQPALGGTVVLGFLPEAVGVFISATTTTNVHATAHYDD